MCVALFCLQLSSSAQSRGIFQPGQQTVEIPFEFENNLMIVEVRFDGVFPLRFIFDTGAEHTILTKREITDLMGVAYEKRFSILGADMSTELYAYLVRNVDLKIGNFMARKRPLLVLEEDYFNFENFAGVQIQGILGADFFHRYVVEIDYRKEVIKLHKPGLFELPDEGFQKANLEIHRNKPYIFGPLTFRQDTTISGKYLLDTGAGLPLLLYTETHPFLHVPPNVILSNIGMGLGGYLQGYLGRIDALEINRFRFTGIITSFQELLPDVDSSYLNGRNGLIGNELLKRFHLIIDYPREVVYFKPEKNFDKAFRYDRSGMVITASGPQLNTYLVNYVLPGSPADEAGVQVGDEILRINWLPASFFSLSNITDKFKKRVGKKFCLKLIRDGEKVKVTFRLRELI